MKIFKYFQFDVDIKLTLLSSTIFNSNKLLKYFCLQLKTTNHRLHQLK